MTINQRLPKGGDKDRKERAVKQTLSIAAKTLMTEKSLKANCTFCPCALGK
jgi:hypothetical protein